MPPAGRQKDRMIDKCDALYITHKDAIYRMALSAVGGDREWALDLLEECMLTAYRDIDRFGDEKSDESKSVITSILQGLINKIYLEAWRKLGVADSGKISAGSAERAETDQILIRNEFTTGLAQYVDRLTNNDKEIVFMRFFRGFTNEETAKRCGITPEEAGKRVYAVKQKIAGMIMER